MSRLKELEAEAIHYLKAFEPKDERGYYLCYSGGKDSDTIKILAQLAGVKFEAHHNLTTVDAPETVYYVRSQKDVIIDLPDRSMWQLKADGSEDMRYKKNWCMWHRCGSEADNYCPDAIREDDA